MNPFLPSSFPQKDAEFTSIGDAKPHFCDAKSTESSGQATIFIDLCTAFKVIFRRGSVTSLGLRSLRVKVTMMTDVQPLLSEGGLL